MHLQKITVKIQSILLYSLAFIIVAAGSVGYAPQASAQTQCAIPNPPTTYGQVTQSVSVATGGVYRVWSRIKPSSTQNNSYYLQVDGGCAINVGDATSLPVGSWSWVSYRDATTTSRIELNLGAGPHTLTYTGREADVQLDRVLLLSDLSCVPNATGNGDDCVNVDRTSPTVSLSSPSAGATVRGTATVTATASDGSGIAKVDFLLDGSTTPIKTITGNGPYSFSWVTTGVNNGSHSLVAKATDNAGNTASTSPVTFNVSNTTTSNLPDLTVSSVSVAPTAPATGERVVFSAVVKNQGSVATPTGTNVTVSFWVDRVKQTWTTSAAAIPAGGSVTLTATNSATSGVNYWTAVTGAHTIEAFVDDQSRISESNEANNKLAVSLNVRTTGISIEGDANNDNRVNGVDYSILVTHIGQNYSAADFNKDGVVGAADLAILLLRWTW